MSLLHSILMILASLSDPKVVKDTAQVSPPATSALVAKIQACFTESADMTKTLKADKTSVKAVQPNVTAVPSLGGNSDPDECSHWVAELKVPSTSDPPAGYSDDFTITATFDGTYMPSEDQCKAAVVSADVYVQKDTGFEYKGGGSFTPSWVEPAVNSDDKPYCLFTANADYKKVSGSVPSSGTKVYRAIVTSSGGASATITVKRKKN